jgi:hypothetical protein
MRRLNTPARKSEDLPASIADDALRGTGVSSVIPRFVEFDRLNRQVFSRELDRKPVKIRRGTAAVSEEVLGQLPLRAPTCGKASEGCSIRKPEDGLNGNPDDASA